jgi:lipoate-protein ligase A
MEEWLSLRSPAGSPALNMALDETLLLNARKIGRPVLRFYSWSEPAASFGYFQRYADVANATSLRPLVRRPTGGGIVPHDSDWTYSLLFPPSHSWYALKAVESYRRLHEWVCSAFKELRIVAELAQQARKEVPGQCFAGAEQFDVVFRDRKIAGAAQRRTRDGLLIQGSIQPPAGANRTAWEVAFAAWAMKHLEVRWRDWWPPLDLEEEARELAHTKYSSDAYNQKR